MESSQPEKAGVEEARREIATGDALAVDVRSDEDWSKGHVPGAIHLPDGDVPAASDRLERGSRLMVIADDGKLAGSAASRLIDAGYDAVAVEGGMGDWTSKDFNLQPTEDPDQDTELGLN